MSAMNPMIMAVLDLLIGVHDPDKPVPEPVPGEGVIAYWTRVVQFQAYELGFADGLDHDQLVNAGYDPRSNTFEEPAT